jgi:peptidoglycan/xylan/chitin deacetylase (PgdA/CDA1 family)
MQVREALPDRLAGRLSEEHLAIFLFHGVIRQQRHRVRNYTSKHLEADLFARCIRRLARAGHALSMDDVLEHRDAGERLPPRAFAVTFDDGFENNLSVAAPILVDSKVPAMVYVTSGFVDSNAMSWIDRIEYVVENAPAQEVSVDWASGAFSLRDSASRIEFLKAVRTRVKSDPSCNADEFADAVCAQLGRPGRMQSEDPLDLKLTWEQIRAAHGRDGIAFGGHGHTHAILSFLSPAELDNELDGSLKMLRENAGIGPTHYSYPEGLEHCYSSAVIAGLRRRGVRCCPTAIDGINAYGADLFHLRRIMV